MRSVSPTHATSGNHDRRLQRRQRTSHTAPPALSPANTAYKCHVQTRHLQMSPSNVACKRHLQTPHMNTACRRATCNCPCTRRLQTRPANAAYKHRLQCHLQALRTNATCKSCSFSREWYASTWPMPSSLHPEHGSMAPVGTTRVASIGPSLTAPIRVVFFLLELLCFEISAGSHRCILTTEPKRWVPLRRHARAVSLTACHHSTTALCPSGPRPVPRPRRGRCH